jgi:hypothetical protein
MLAMIREQAPEILQTKFKCSEVSLAFCFILAGRSSCGPTEICDNVPGDDAQLVGP